MAVQILLPIQHMNMLSAKLRAIIRPVNQPVKQNLPAGKSY